MPRELVAIAPRQPVLQEYKEKNLIKRITKLGYNGFIGLEYRPLTGFEESLARSWIPLDAVHLSGESGVLRTLTRVRDV